MAGLAIRVIAQIPKIAAKTTNLALAGATGYEVANIINEAQKPDPIITVPSPPPPTPTPPTELDSNATIIMLLVSILLLLAVFVVYYVAMKVKDRISDRAVQRFKANVGLPV